MKQYLGIVLWVIATGAWLVSFWASTEMIKKARDAGYRYWAINPIGMLHSLRSKEFVVSLVAGVVVAVCVLSMFALRYDLRDLGQVFEHDGSLPHPTLDQSQ